MSKIVQARVRHIISPDVADLVTFRPEADAFAVLLMLLVGPHDGPGEESFDVLVCSPAWLAAQGEPVIGRHKLVVNDFDFRAIEAFLRRHVESCFGETWSEVGTKVGRIGHWEFEDYSER